MLWRIEVFKFEHKQIIRLEMQKKFEKVESLCYNDKGKNT